MERLAPVPHSARPAAPLDGVQKCVRKWDQKTESAARSLAKPLLEVHDKPSGESRRTPDAKALTGSGTYKHVPQESDSFADVSHALGLPGLHARQLILGGAPSWLTRASFHLVAMIAANPWGAGPTGLAPGCTSSRFKARLCAWPAAPRPL